MLFYWINCRITQGQFLVFWRPGPENLGDYHSKHYPPAHHIAVWFKYLHVPNYRSLQGCVNLTVRMNPIKQEIQQSLLQHSFLGYVYEPLPLNSTQSNARARARGGEDTQTVTSNGIAHARSVDNQHIITNHITLPILQVMEFPTNRVE